MRKEICIVSGFPRSGTSMMMMALNRGGLPAYYSEERDAMNDFYGDEHYKVNKYGFFEASVFADFECLVGKCVKIMHNHLVDFVRASPYDCRVIFMVRHPIEILNSYQAAFNNVPCRGFLYKYWRLCKNILKSIQCPHMVVSYNKLLSSPNEIFSKIDSFIPIDIQKAISAVDKTQYRFKRQTLDA